MIITKTSLKLISTTVLIVSSLLWSLTIKAQQITGPETAFDAKEAKALLEPGKSIVKGISYYAPKAKIGIRNMNKSTWRMNVNEEVFLYPMTKHLEEWAKMRKKTTYGNKIYKLSNECMEYYKSAIINEYGKFEIKNIKPGRYWILTNYDWSGNAYGDEKTLRFEKFIEIKSDGDVSDIKLTN
ncbi:hypothetical protein [Flavobacterium sp.]|uniref:hypothetical protein n=1 Tax=Flavobacterium sp. TaxID=239 RepID=UPI003267B431